MARIKIDYGIDLGTTNSAICRMEKGKPVIIKTDVLKDTMPSCVSFTKKCSVKAGDAAFNDLKADKRRASKSGKKDESNAYVEFKRTMATTTRYHSSFMNRDYSSEELSAEVLKTLKSFVTDETVNSVVITVPAKFTVNQKTATIEAAKLAGFSHCELLQEPIAASMAYGLDSDDKNGLWMVFDFGGGTFDAALLKVEDGIMQVFDTEGDNYLGGKNLDYAIVDNILIPYLMDNFALGETMADADKKELLRDAMKTYAEDVKNQLSFKEKEDVISNLGELGEDEDGEEIELDLTITQAEIFEVMRPYFQKAVDICKNLLQRNKLSGDQINKLILVGGPTHSPLIRQMLREQITPNVDTSIDPMTAVATGAALYASTLDTEVNDEVVEVGTVKLKVGYEATSVETVEYVTLSLDDNTYEKVWVELVRADKAWSSGRVEINNMGDVVEVSLLESKPNSFSIVAYDEKGNSLPCFPEEITIIQGTKVGAAPLPYNIGIAIWNNDKQRAVFRMAGGLEKNKPLPAIGVVNDLKTTKRLRPGVKSDVLTIPVYQVDDFSQAEGKTASLYEHVGDVVITGEEVNELIAEDSLVDVTLKVDSSEQMKLEVHFLATDITVEKVFDTSKKQSVGEDADKEIKKGLSDASSMFSRLSADGISVSDLERRLNEVKEEYANSSEKKMVLSHLREVLRDMEKLEDSTEWQRVEKELREEFEHLEKAQNDLGNEKTAQVVNQLRLQTDSVIRSKDPKTGREVLEQIHSLFFSLTMIYQCIGLIKSFNDRFGSIRWKDSSRARQLINRGMEEINDNPTVEKLRPIVAEIFKLLPEEEAANAGGLLK